MIFATFRLDLPLKKLFIRVILDFNKLRNFNTAMNTRNVFPLYKIYQSRFDHS
mgnify:CR=1 FL=1